MTKWIIKHYNVITICLGVVSLYLLVQFFRDGMPFKLQSPLFWWGFMNMWANAILSTYDVNLLESDLMLSEEDADIAEYYSLLDTRRKVLRVASIYALVWSLLLVYGFYQNFVIH
jgi:hypothetical protein